MNTHLPGQFEHTALEHLQFLVTPDGLEEGGAILLEPWVTSTYEIADRLVPGTVLVLDTSTSRYRVADHSTAASFASTRYILASEAADSDWQSATITATPDGDSSRAEQVALAADDDTNAEVIAALRADPGFSALVSDMSVDSTGFIRFLPAPGLQSLNITSSLSTAFGASGQTARQADYRILAEHVDTHDIDTPTASPGPVRVVANVRKGHFRTSALSNLTADARAVLSARGGKFD